MKKMFANCWFFNQPLDAWDVSSVRDMRYMFSYALCFDQNLDTWQVKKANTEHMFNICPTQPKWYKGNSRIP